MADQHWDYINPVSVAELEQAKQRLHLLRADMSPEEVFTALGLKGYYGRCFAVANGGGGGWVSYTLRNGRVLHLVYGGFLPARHRLVSVSVDGVERKFDDNKNH